MPVCYGQVCGRRSNTTQPDYIPPEEQDLFNVDVEKIIGDSFFYDGLYLSEEYDTLRNEERAEVHKPST